jgi:TrmH family RNA methyltransferase
MKDKVITSRDNALVRRARAVCGDHLDDLIFIEGVRLCEEAVLSSLSIQDVLYTQRLASEERGARLLHELSKRCKRMTAVSEQVFVSVSDTKRPQGIILLADKPPTGPDELLKGISERGSGVDKEEAINQSTLDPQLPLIVVMHRINNPANAGAILRTAEAAGATGAVTTRSSTDLFSPKALRGAMGSSFRLPLWTGAQFSEVLAWCAEHDIRTVCADAASARAHTDIDWRVARALIVGAEATGLDATEIAAAGEAVRVPMRAPVESLNVAVAAAIMLYEAARQRS